MTEVTNEIAGTEIVAGEKKELDNVCRQLLASDRLRESDLAKAQAYQSQHGGDLLTLLVRLGLASERDVAETISEAAAHYAAEVRARTFPGIEQTYQPK